MATPPSSLKKKNKKRRSLQDSPRQWVPLSSNPNVLVPNSKKDQYDDVDLSDSVLPSGLVKLDEGVLHCTVTSLTSVDIGEHVPIRPDSMLIHPVTMETLGIAIATTVVVECGEASVSVCRVWPCLNLPLDVVGVGRAPLLSLECSVGGKVRVSPLPSTGSSLIAGNTLLEPVSQDPAEEELLMNKSFQNYCLHMHTGCSVVVGSHLCVQYYGEERPLKIVSITLLESDSNTQPHLLSMQDDLSQQLSTLTLSHQSPPTPQTTLTLPTPHTSHTVYKITLKTKLVVQSKAQSSTEISGPTLTSVAGADKQVQLLRELVLYPLQHRESCQGIKFPHGVILYGPPGVGKSLLAQALTNETLSHAIRLSASELLLGSQDSEGKIQEAFHEAKKHAPSLIVLDDLHVLCPHRNSAPSEGERRSTATLLTCLDSLGKSPRHVVMIATTNQIEGVEPSLRRPGRFDLEIEIPAPNAAQRRDILIGHLSTIDHTLSDEDITLLADSAHGHVGADLLAVCSEAQHKALHRRLTCEGVESVMVCAEDVRQALKEVRPSAMREVALEVPKVYWSDIGGQEKVKERMREAIEWPLTHPECFVRLGVRPPRGVLLYGPPGCSKTMVARALATESELNFIAVKGPELFSKWVGDSELAVRQVFRRARAAAPAIIFFDEIDALAVQRKGEGSTVGDRVLAQLLTEMDGVETLSEVLVVAATNRPDMIDKALLRPGRIDRMIYVPLPDESTRRQILEIQFKKTPIGKDVSVSELVTRTHGYSGAELVSLCQEAALCALHEDMNSTLVGHAHFVQALETVRPQTDKNTLELYQNYK